MGKRSLHFASWLALGSACSPSDSAPHPGPDESERRATAEPSAAREGGVSPADDEAAIVVDTGRTHAQCLPFERPLRRLLRLSSSRDLVSEMARIQLVQTRDPAVGRTTTFDVIQTLVGSRATAFEWEHGGRLHPINTMVEPNKLFVLFELAPSTSAWGGCFPDGPFIRNVEGPRRSYAATTLPPPLLEIPGVEIASNRDVARALAASLPIHGAKVIGVDMPAGSNSSSETLGFSSFGFHPQPAPMTVSWGAEPMPPVTSVAVTAALRIDGPRGRIVVTGSHSTPIGAREGHWLRALAYRSEPPPKDRQFQILAETDGGELTIVSTWFSQRGG